ncbi:MAG: hypothetical protein ABSH31_20480 [Bryobacteraceae bacterium]
MASTEHSIQAGGTVESVTPGVRLLIEAIRRIDGYDEAKEAAAGELVKT